MSISSATTKTLTGMLLGRLLVGIGLGVGPPVASMYIAEVKKLLTLCIMKMQSITFFCSDPILWLSLQVSPAHVRGTFGSSIQIATCLGLMGAFVVGIPVKSIMGW